MSNVVMAARRRALMVFCRTVVNGQSDKGFSHAAPPVSSRRYGSVVQPHGGGDPVMGQFIFVCNLTW